LTIVKMVGMEEIVIHNHHWIPLIYHIHYLGVSDCCLTLTQQFFSYIMAI